MPFEYKHHLGPSHPSTNVKLVLVVWYLDPGCRSKWINKQQILVLILKVQVHHFLLSEAQLLSPRVKLYWGNKSMEENIADHTCNSSLARAHLSSLGHAASFPSLAPDRKKHHFGRVKKSYRYFLPSHQDTSSAVTSTWKPRMQGFKSPTKPSILDGVFWRKICIPSRINEMLIHFFSTWNSSMYLGRYCW